MKTLKQKIKDLETKIKEFGAKYSGDALTSYNEATQAALTVEVYKKQLDELKKQNNKSQIEDKKFVLKNDSGEIEITVSFSMIDPAKRIISANSPVGKKLLSSSLNKIIVMGDSEFTIIKIS